MNLLDFSFSDPALNLALEEVLLRPFIKKADEAPSTPLVRLWQNPASIIIGRGENPSDTVHLEQAKALNYSLYRRISGGGTVVHGSGNINLSFFLPFSLDPKLLGVYSSYEYILSRVLIALKTLGANNAVLRGSSDLCIGDKKISGTAQARKRSGLLHHLSLLVDFDLSIITSLLKKPPKEPEYRMGRDHKDFVTTLKLEGFFFDRQLFLNALSEAFKSSFTPVPILTNSILDQVQKLAEKKYRSSCWNEKGKEH